MSVFQLEREKKIYEQIKTNRYRERQETERKKIEAEGEREHC